MSQEATFNKLKSLTQAEVDTLCRQKFEELAEDGLVPLDVLRTHCDEILKPYGLTYDRAYPINFSDFS